MRIVNPLTVDDEATDQARAVLRLLMVASSFMSFGFSAWGAMFNNFAVDVMHLGADQVGLIQSVREVPGLLGFILGYLVMLVPEMRLVGFCVALLGGGLLITAGSSTYMVLLVGTTVMSVGFHFYDTCNQSLVLTWARRQHAPRIVGGLASIGALAGVAGTLAVALLTKSLGFRDLLYILGGITVVGGLIVSVLGRQSAQQKQNRKVVFRKKYWLYYLLTFLMGSRRHIASTFAIFLLVDEFKMPVERTAILYLVNSIITTYAYQQIGHLTARFGERRVLAVTFLLLVGIFTGYAYITWLPLLIALFMVDNSLFGSYLAVNTYFQKIAETKEEITSNVSMAQTINHISAVFVPAVGGLLWRLYGHQATFLMGTAIVLVSLVMVRWMHVEPSVAPAVAEG